MAWRSYHDRTIWPNQSLPVLSWARFLFYWGKYFYDDDDDKSGTTTEFAVAAEKKKRMKITKESVIFVL